MRRESSAFILSSFLHRHVLCLISLSLSHTHTPLLSLILPAFLETPLPSLAHCAAQTHGNNAVLLPPVCPSTQSSSLSGKIARPNNRHGASEWFHVKSFCGGLFAPENQTLQPCQRRGRSVEKVSFSSEHRRRFVPFISKMGFLLSFFLLPSCDRRALICILLMRLINKRLPASIPLTPPCPCFSPLPRHPPFIVVLPDRPPVCTHAQRRFN